MSGKNSFVRCSRGESVVGGKSIEVGREGYSSLGEIRLFRRSVVCSFAAATYVLSTLCSVGPRCTLAESPDWRASKGPLVLGVAVAVAIAVASARRGASYWNRVDEALALGARRNNWKEGSITRTNNSEDLD